MAITKENIKENNNLAIAKLNNCPTSPRKMRIVADLVRGKNVDQALDIFRFSQKEASRKLEKLLLSAIRGDVVMLVSISALTAHKIVLNFFIFLLCVKR